MPGTSDSKEAASLVEQARLCLERAYVPYSDFPVAAAVLDEAGRVFTGVNVENASYGLTVCAERVAIFTAIAAGARELRAIAVTAKKLRPVTPCGACRQVMAEFFDAGSHVYLDGASTIIDWTLGELLPAAFTASDLTLEDGLNSSLRRGVVGG